MKITKYIKKKNKQKQKPPQIVIVKDAFTKLAQYSRAKKVEIMLLGVIEKKEETYFITDFVIPPQTSNTGAFVTTHDEKYTEWLQKMPREERKKLRLHYHTHPNMATTPSSTDQKTIRDKVENISDFYIRMIGNEDLEFHIDFFDLANEILYEEMDMYLFLEDYTIVFSKKEPKIVYPQNENAEKELDEMITTTVTYVTHRHSNYYDDYYGKLYGSRYGSTHTTTPKAVNAPKTKDPEKDEAIKTELKKYNELVQELDELIDMTPVTEMEEMYASEALLEKLCYQNHIELVKIFKITKGEWEDYTFEEYHDYFLSYVDIINSLEETV